MPSIRDVAEQSGVSIATVSRVMNGEPNVAAETRERVLDVARRIGYGVRAGPASAVNIAFAYTHHLTVSHPFDAALLQGVYETLDESRFNVALLAMAREKAPGESFRQFFARKSISGVLLRTSAMPSRGFCRQIADEGFPHVVLSERFDSEGVNFVDGNSKPDSIRAMEYLLQLGHKRIAFVMHTIPDRDQRDRFEAYNEVLAAHGIEFDGHLVLRHPKTITGGASAMELALRLTRRPTALFLADPLLAVGALNKARELGVRVPQDISLLGVDDSDLRHTVYPPLTAICRDARALGAEAARSLVRILDGTPEEQPSVRRSIPTFFEINGSTAPPPSSTD